MLDVKSWLGWKEHYLVLRDGIIYVFTGKVCFPFFFFTVFLANPFTQGGSRKYKIPLYDSHFEPLESLSDGRFGFKLLAKEGDVTEVQFSCGDEIENQQWLNAILKQKLMIEEAINLISF
jgi:hypothetical protein